MTSTAAPSLRTWTGRDQDKSNANVLILGNSGQGKSYFLKLLLCNILESGKRVVGPGPGR